MKHTKTATGCTGADYKTITEFAKELNITPVLNKIQEYRINWLERVNRMLRNTLCRIQKKKSTDQQVKKPGETVKETSRSVKQEWVNK